MLIKGMARLMSLKLKNILVVVSNRLFAASHSRGTKRHATFALQHGGFVPREWLAAKGLSR